MQDLNDFYGENVDGFEGSSEEAVLASDDAVDQLTDLHDRIGDNGAGVVLALVWARFAQQQTGSNEGRDEFGQLLQQACLTGGWFLDVLERDPDSNEGRSSSPPATSTRPSSASSTSGTPEGTDSSDRRRPVRARRLAAPGHHARASTLRARVSRRAARLTP